MPAKTAAPAPAAKKAPAAAPATKPAAAAKPAAAPKAAAASTTGIYISPIDLRNQSAEEVRDRFTVYGPVSQLRVKRNKKVKAPYALVWFKSAEDAKKAVAEIKTTEPEGTTVEFIKAAKPVEARTTTASTIHINPINVPTRSSKGYGKLAKKIRDLFPESVKTRLHREDDGTGSALVYFKDNSAASAAKAKLNGKLFDRPVVVKPCCRTLVKDQKRFVAVRHPCCCTTHAASSTTLPYPVTLAQLASAQHIIPSEPVPHCCLPS